MRLLALSDIHNNPWAVELLCRAEAGGRFDAVVVAGDLGSETAGRTLARLVAGFGAPVLYVFGNWDARLPYAPPLAPGAHHLHEGAVRLGGHVFAGFSGCAANWGRNPFALAERRALRERFAGSLPALPDARRRSRGAAGGDPALRAHAAARREADRRILRENVAALARRAAEAAPPGTPAVVVTHERVFRLAEALPAARLHLFGHVHGFKHTASRGLHSVNVSSLDWPRGRGGAAAAPGAPVEGDPAAATYAVVEVAPDGAVRAEPRRLPSR